MPSVYDVQIRRLLQYYDDMIATGVEVLAALAPADAHVLDLGGGTGAFSSAVLDGLRGARVTLLDVDADMLSRARRRLARFGDRISFREASFLGPLPAVDVVVASLALHHVHDLDTKVALYRAVRDALSPGGVLLNLDAAVTEGSATETDLCLIAWRSGWEITGSVMRRRAGISTSWATEDHYFPLDAELGALREAGFDEVECFWRRGLSAVTCALRTT